jgi:hypothetical protein
MHTAPPPLGTAYRYIDFICNGKTNSENMIFVDNALCTRGRDPSRVGVEVSEVVPVLSAPQTLQATAEAEGMPVVGQQAAKADQPARIPLVVVTPEAPAAQAGTPEAKPACIPAAQAATVEAKR